MHNKYDHIAVWPDGVWCYVPAIEERMHDGKSDDFVIVKRSTLQTDDEGEPILTPVFDGTYKEAQHGN